MLNQGSFASIYCGRLRINFEKVTFCIGGIHQLDAASEHMSRMTTCGCPTSHTGMYLLSVTNQCSMNRFLSWKGAL
jgi:hypothetical protein